MVLIPMDISKQFNSQLNGFRGFSRLYVVLSVVKLTVSIFKLMCLEVPNQWMILKSMQL